MTFLHKSICSDSKERDKFYTKRSVARDCYDLFVPYISDDTHLIEPSAGDGAFLDACAGRKIIGYDIAPERADIVPMDFLSDVRSLIITSPSMAMIGNPPFGKASALALEFLNAGLDLSGLVGFVLPRAIRRWSAQSRVRTCARLLLDVNLPAQAFEFGGRPYDVGCVFQVWSTRHTNHPDLRLRQRPPNRHPDFEARLYSGDGRPLDWSWATMAVYRTGKSRYVPILPGSKLNPRRQYVLFRAHGRAQERLLKLDYEAMSRGYTRVPGFSLADVVGAYEAALHREGLNDNQVLRTQAAA